MTVLALLNFNDLQGVNSFLDETGNQNWSIFGGTPIVDTSESKFGGSSLYLDGSNNNAIECTLNTPLTGDFTIEFWYKPISTGVNKSLLSFPNLNSAFTQALTQLASITGINLYMAEAEDVSNNIVIPDTLANITSRFNHLAIVRKNGLLNLFVNGRMLSKPETRNTVIITDVRIGLETLSIGNSNYVNEYIGWVDGFRISDTVVYESAFIPPTTPPTLIDVQISTLSSQISNYLFSPFDNVYAPLNNVNSYQLNSSGVGDSEVIGDPTSTNIITGNVEKLGQPYRTKVVAVSVELNHKIIGFSFSDEVTGNYSIDVYPWEGDVLVFTSPDYGLKFNPSSAVAIGQIIHPTIPNHNVYEVLVAGTLGTVEPIWGEINLNSGDVTLKPLPLYRPLMNGFVKPVITPIV